MSHKLLRWFSGISLALGTACLVLAVARAGYAEVLAGLLLLGVAFALAGWQRWATLLERFWEIAIALAGTAIGIRYLIRGGRFPSLEAAAIRPPNSGWTVTAR